MESKLEIRLQRDIDQILSLTVEMGKMVETALDSCRILFKEKNKRLAYSIIINDQNIDHLEIELDRLCQEFLIRHQPAAGILRFIYATIKIVNELERIGDYAEGIARNYLNICDYDPQPSFDGFLKMANRTLPMFRNAVESYKHKDYKLAKKTMKNEHSVDEMRYRTEGNLINMQKKGQLFTEIFSPLITISSRFERIADRSCNICEEVWYMSTGEEIKHYTSGPIKILFIDKRNACRAQIATAIGNALGLNNFHFSSAGISQQDIDPKTIEFMNKKGFDISKHHSTSLDKIKDLTEYNVIIALSKHATKVFPPPPSKTIQIVWEIKDPSRLKAKRKEIDEAYEKTYKFIEEHINGLIFAINNQKLFKKEIRK